MSLKDLLTYLPFSTVSTLAKAIAPLLTLHCVCVFVLNISRKDQVTISLPLLL